MEAMRTFPGEESIAALLQEALRLKSADDRRQETGRALRRVEELRRSSAFQKRWKLLSPG